MCAQLLTLRLFTKLRNTHCLNSYETLGLNENDERGFYLDGIHEYGWLRSTTYDLLPCTTRVY